MTAEEQLLARYFEAFNRHDLADVLECFHAQPLIIDSAGARYAGRDEVQRYYETSFALFPDARCDLRMLTGNDGHGVAESFFHGTRPRFGKVVEALGAEIAEIVDGKIKELRDYHRPMPAPGA
ncbi:MAG: nuclear transport factor 2 family protein [Candidatus Binataceae bacterium]